jgi:hypothetical protein
MQKADLIMASRFGAELDKLDFGAKLRRFEHLTFLKPNVKTNALHIMLNFDPADHLDQAKLQQLAASYMERIGFGEQPYLVYRHHDAYHPHLHIVTTNITSQGQRIDLHGIGRTQSEEARKELEIEYGLIKAEGRSRSEMLDMPAFDIQKAIYGKSANKRAITNTVWAVLRTYKFTSFAEYNAILNQFNVAADRGKEDTVMFEKRGVVYSIIDADGKRIGIPFKASELSGRPMLDEVEKKYARSAEIRKTYKESVTDRVDTVQRKYASLTISTFARKMAAQKIAVVFRKNAAGLIYGVTYVDHRTKCVFNGSDLGKAYSAKALVEGFSDRDQLKTYLKLAKAGGHDVQQSALSEGTPQRETHFLEMALAKTHEETSPAVFKRRKKRKAKQSHHIGR